MTASEVSKPVEPTQLKPSLAQRAVVKFFKLINKLVSWHKLPTLMGTFVSRCKVTPSPWHVLTSSEPTEGELMTPNPRLVSETFMKRTLEEFKPATTLNLLAAAWIQSQVGQLITLRIMNGS